MLINKKKKTGEVLVKMPPAARGSFEKPPLDPTKLFIYLFFHPSLKTARIGLPSLENDVILLP
jgi:hypothetical protein